MRVARKSPAGAAAGTPVTLPRIRNVVGAGSCGGIASRNMIAVNNRFIRGLYSDYSFGRKNLERIIDR
jgi:hypothetical protein